jgi:Fe-S cluster biosynthesis and repair protein YggX
MKTTQSKLEPEMESVITCARQNEELEGLTISAEVEELGRLLFAKTITWEQYKERALRAL